MARQRIRYNKTAMTENPAPTKTLPAGAQPVRIMFIRGILDAARVPYKLSQEIHTHKLWEFSDPATEELALIFAQKTGKKLVFSPDHGYLWYEIN